MFQTRAPGVILALCLTFVATLAEAQQYAAAVMDARTGRFVHASNADTRLHPASLTKMMTLYVVFDEIRRGRMSLDQKVTVSAHAAAEPPSRLGLRAGQEIEVRYLIRAAAIKSANDAATALGEAVAGSQAAFARKMNAYARAMGMTNTQFKNANGLTDTGHYSSARDMAVLGRRLIYDFPQYYNIFSRNSTSAGIATVQNTNRRLLDAYPGADGIKTGYTRAAGFNLVSSAERGNERVIVALFGGRSSTSRNHEVARLMDVGFAAMPSRVQVAALPPLTVGTAPGAVVATAASTRGSTAGVVASGTDAMPVRSVRPMPRGTLRRVEVARGTDSIAQAIAEVNADLAAEEAAEAEAPPAAGRPAPRPEGARSSEAEVPIAVDVAAAVQSASTFAVAAAEPVTRSEVEQVNGEGDGDALAGAGTTGGNDWGVQLGAYRSRGDAERQLLTTALKDLPPLMGGLRRVESAKVQGVTIYRAQFVGLTRDAAVDACATLERMNADCIPLSPGT